MAKLDDLIARIPEPALRTELAAAAEEMRKRKRFGLVFEEHVPEVTVLRDFPIKPGDTVVRRDDATAKKPLLVEKVTTKEATVRPANDESAPAESVSQTELMTVKRFGEPIYPALTSVASVNQGEGRASNAVINGENYHVLQLLTFLHEGQVDCVYLDPPYNTGAKDWKYNNDYVDTNDAWRHSKWLSMMEKRLRLVKRLLKDDSVLIVTIDEHEVHHLGVLLEQIFPDAVRQLVSIVINPKGVTETRFSRVEEYAFFCFLGTAEVSGFGDDLLTPLTDDVGGGGSKPRWKGLLRSGTNARRKDRENLFFPVLIDPGKGAVVGAGDPLPLDEEPDFGTKIDGCTPVWPVRKDKSLGNWGVGHITLRELIKKGYVRVGGFDEARNTWALTYLTRRHRDQIDAGVLQKIGFDDEKNVIEVQYSDLNQRRIKRIWHRSTHDAGANGSDLLKAFLPGERKFSFPKSLYAVRDCLGAVLATKTDALVVDVFAGSGTTLHASMSLNSQDGGSRRCILVTNNELSVEDETRLRKEGRFPGDEEFESHGVFEAVAKPRLTSAITGKLPDGTPVSGTYVDGTEYAKGFSETCEFFRMDYLEPSEVELGRQFEAILPSLWLAAGAKGKRPTTEAAKGFLVPDDCPFGVLLSEAKFREFSEVLTERDDVTHVWLVTDSERAFADMREALPGQYRVAMLYRDFLRNFAINTRRTR